MEKDKYELYIIWLTFAIGFLSMLFLTIMSEGTHIHDEIGHFLISRDALFSPKHIFDTWGRTFNTLLYILPSQFGLIGARLFSLTLAIFTVFLTLKVSRMLDLKQAFLVPLFLIMQPWFSNLSYLCITEIPFSLLMILAVYLFLRKNNVAASIIVGLLPLIRHEGIALAGLWVLYMLYKKDWRSVIISFLPLFLYNIILHLFEGNWPIAMFFNTTPNNIYGSGPWYHFLIRLPHPKAAGIPIMFLAIFSIIPIIKSKIKMKLIFIWYLSYFALHTIIFRYGLFASGGYILFLLPLAPAIAIASVIGLNRIITFYNQYFNTPLKAGISFVNEKSISLLICTICILFALLNIKPHKLSPEDRAMQEAVEWIRKKDLSKNNLISTNVYFYHFLPFRVPTVTLWEKFPPLDSLQAGTVVVWDNIYSNRWGIHYDKLNSNPKEWRFLKAFGDSSVIVFYKNPP